MSFRSILTVVALAAVLVVMGGQIRKLLDNPAIWPPDDFIEYWAAAKLAREGKNPYDATLLLPLQQDNGRLGDDGKPTQEAIMMWNPPWTLTFVLPLGFVPARGGQLLWLLVNLAALGFCGDRLWKLLGGDPQRRWIGWLIAFAALPSMFALQSGQIGPLLLLGAVLFLECEQRGWYFLAGAATVLLAIKPHLAYLVWLAILGDAVVRGRWRTLIGGVVAGAICAAFPMLFDPQVWQQYADAMGNRPPEQWKSPTLGTLLRMQLGEDNFRLQFVPVLIGLVWFAFHFAKHARRWDWREQLPLLLLVSFVTAPYGAWPFDMVLLLPAAVAIVVNLNPTPTPQPPPPQGEGVGGWGRAVLIALILVNVACLVQNLLKCTSFQFMWVSPVVLGLYILTHTFRTPRATNPISTDSLNSPQLLMPSPLAGEGGCERSEQPGEG